jgi:hypothetical protein
MRTLGALLGLSLFFTAGSALATPFTVYDDALSSSFSDKSVQTTPSYSSTSNVYSGSDCVSVLLFSGAEMIVASGGTPDISQYGGVDFYHRTNAGSLTLVVQLRSSTQAIGNSVNVSVSSTWTNAHLTLADFGLNQNSGTIVGIQFSSTTLNTPGMALDQITLFDVQLDGGSDASILDAGAPDASIDGGSIDAGSLDGGSSDASTGDASTSDSGATDGGTNDSGTTDASSNDAQVDAASKPDASAKDAAPSNDAGGEPDETSGGCSCDLAAPTGYASAIPLALVALALIARRRRS